MQDLIGKKVEVNTAETEYRGVLIEIGEKDVYLQLETEWIVIPVDKIVDIEAVG